MLYYLDDLIGIAQAGGGLLQARMSVHIWLFGIYVRLVISNFKCTCFSDTQPTYMSRCIVI